MTGADSIYTPALLQVLDNCGFNGEYPEISDDQYFSGSWMRYLFLFFHGFKVEIKTAKTTVSA
jgi:hypothetical protein